MHRDGKERRQIIKAMMWRQTMNLKDTVEIVKAGGSDETNQCRNSI